MGNTHLLAGALAFLGLAYAQDKRCWRNSPCTGPAAPAFEGPWEKNNFAPDSRFVKPRTVHTIKGARIGDYQPKHEIKGNGSALVFDFGVEVGGIVSFGYQSTGNVSIGLAFTESKNYIGYGSDSSNGMFRGPDGAVFAQVRPANETQKWTMPAPSLRGGFRYLTIFLNNTDSATAVQFSNIETEIAFQPTWPNMRAYQGYFHSSDDTLNKIWYMGAYTLQTNCVPTNTGRQVPMLSRGWANNATLGPGATIIVDGAKRDRAVWPGDMGIAVPSIYFSTGDLESIKNALQVLFDYQLRDGSFPEAGPPLLQRNSDSTSSQQKDPTDFLAYHMWTLVGVYNYILYTGDLAFLNLNWAKYTKALDYVLRKINDRGLLNVSGNRDWARLNQGGENTEANILLYHTLVTASRLAIWKGDQVATVSRFYSTRAQTLKTSINNRLFDAPGGAFRDSSARPQLHPQDANALAIVFEATTAPRARQISTRLTRNWTPIGPSSPELPGNISPFVTSIELRAHFLVGETARALDLLRRTWGWYLRHPNGTQSTMIEGYRTDGSWGYRAARGYRNDASYVSHAHGWSTGPTSALTNFVAGMDILERAGARWAFNPQFGDLSFAEAGFVTPLGRYRSRWVKLTGGGSGEYDVGLDTPKASAGILLLPRLARPGMMVWVNGERRNVTEDTTGVTMELPGGEYNITVRQGEPPPPPPRPKLTLPRPRPRLGGLLPPRGGILGNRDRDRGS